MKNPLILITNDDGVNSAGLWAAVDALLPLGDVIVVAPDRQWSGAGRSMPPTVSGNVTESSREIGGKLVPVYAVDATPALCVVHAMIEFVPRLPNLVVSGINFGENIGMEVTISGTIGAALEAAAYGVPGLAVSLEMEIAAHMNGGHHKDYSAAQAFAAHFARRMLERSLPTDVDVLNVNIPTSAVRNTPWLMTRLSRHRYFRPLGPDRANGNNRPGYTVMDDFSLAERNSDIWALRVKECVSVTPLSMDMTSRTDFGAVEEDLRTDW